MSPIVNWEKMVLTMPSIGLGTSFGYLFWYVEHFEVNLAVEKQPDRLHRYGYHVPEVRKRDLFYSKLEEQRAANAAA
jgi:hypothetical protein